MASSLVQRQREVSDSRFIADLVGVFERRKIAVGDARACEQFETLLATNDAFRSQLFTLCAAISRMSASDLTGYELLDLVGRALGVTWGAAELPESLRAEFLAGYDAWIHRDLLASYEKPMARKPSAREKAAREPRPPDAAANPARPGGLPTVQEALELARIRNPVEMPPPRETVAEPASRQMRLDTSSLTIQELNALLKEIEERMARLSPQLSRMTSASEAPPVLVPPLLSLRRDLSAAAPESMAGPAASYAPERNAALSASADAEAVEVAPLQLLSLQARVLASVPMQSASLEPVPSQYSEDEFLARHAYLRPGWRKAALAAQLEPWLEAPSATAEIPAAVTNAAPVVVTPTADPVVPIRTPASPPAQAASDGVPLKTYVLIIALAALVLIAAPLAGMVVYRSLHPVYIYHLAPPATAPAPAEPAAPEKAGKSAKPQSKPGTPSHKQEPARRQSPAGVWPSQP